MRTAPLLRLVSAFGDVLVRHREQQNLTVDALATAAGLYASEVRGLERGEYGPTLKDVFRLASALGEEPLMLLVDVVGAWRADPTDTLHRSRSSDFARLFRLGYHHKQGDSASCRRPTIPLPSRQQPQRNSTRSATPVK